MKKRGDMEFSTVVYLIIAAVVIILVFALIFYFDDVKIAIIDFFNKINPLEKLK